MNVGKERKVWGLAVSRAWLALFLGPVWGLMTEMGREGETVGTFLDVHNLLWLPSGDIRVFLLNYWETGTMLFIIYKMTCLIPW